MRFKIDFCTGSYSPFRLYWRKPTFYGGLWMKIEDFKTQAEAKAHYDLIKDLPEYLP